MDEPARLPTQLEVSGLIRSVQAEGGFATVLAKGDADAGAILVVLTFRGEGARAYERMPSADGHRVWHCSLRENADNPMEFAEWLTRRKQRDPDLWIVELDIAQGERFIDL